MSTSPPPITNSQSNFLLDLILAGTASAIGKTITAPLDRVKLLLQSQSSIKTITTPYKGIINCFSRLVKSEGILSLWRGNLPNVIRYFPSQSLNFAFKDTFKTKLIKPNNNKDDKIGFYKYALGSALSGGLAGTMSLFVCHPFDLVRTRMATDNMIETNNGKISYKGRNFNGMQDCFKKLYLTSGINALYKGMMVSILGAFSFRAFYFGGYDTLKSIFDKYNSNKKNSTNTNNKVLFLLKFSIAHLVSVTASTLFYPLDTIRRRIMIESGKNYEEMIYKNARDCFIKIYYSKEGYLGFYKGYATNALRTMGGSLVLVLYDEFQKVMGVKARGGR